MDSVKEISYKNKTIKIYMDDTPESPREWENLGQMICKDHSNYILGDKHNMDTEDLKEKVKSDAYLSLPLYLSDNSGITMSTSPFSYQWDSGQVGYIIISKDKIKKEFLAKKVSKIISKKLKEKVLDILQSEVEMYDQYLTGEVYGYDTGNDSCWGFYDLNVCIEEAKQAIDYELSEYKKSHFQKLKSLIKNKVNLNYRPAYNF